MDVAVVDNKSKPQTTLKKEAIYNSKPNVLAQNN